MMMLGAFSSFVVAYVTSNPGWEFLGGHSRRPFLFNSCFF